LRDCIGHCGRLSGYSRVIQDPARGTGYVMLI
jgi:hypothetical protein